MRASDYSDDRICTAQLDLVIHLGMDGVMYCIQCSTVLIVLSIDHESLSIFPHGSDTAEKEFKMS